MPIGDAVAGGDDPKLYRGASSLKYPLSCILGDLLQIIVTRYQSVPGIGNTDQRAIQIIVAETHGFKKSAHLGPSWSLKIFLASEFFHRILILPLSGIVLLELE